MDKLLSFDEMITPLIITLVYWLALAGAVIAGLATAFGGFGGFSVMKLLMGLGFTAGAALGARITCELLIVLFKIHEKNIHSIARSGDGIHRAA